MSMGADRETLINAVRDTKHVVSPRKLKIVRGPLSQWAVVLARWVDDPQFVDAEGRPKDLPFSGEGSSFSRLVELDLPGEDPAVGRDLLLAAESIVKLPSGKLRWRYRDVLWRQRNTSKRSSAEMTIFADEFLKPIREVLSCSEVNLTQRFTKSKTGSFQRAVTGVSLHPKDVAEFRAFLVRHGMAFLEVIDDWLTQRARMNKSVGGSNLINPYVGLFLTTESVPRSSKSARLKNKDSSS